MLAVCASGHTLWDDLSRVPGYDPNAWSQPFEIMAVNDAGMHIPHRLAHWYSNDGWLKHWGPARRPHFHNQEGPRGARNERIRYHCWQPIAGFPVEVHDVQGGGTSSLNACLVAKRLGYQTIYLCGAPLDNGPHYFDPPWTVNNFDNTAELGVWRTMKDELGGVVSLSGNTKLIMEN